MPKLTKRLQEKFELQLLSIEATRSNMEALFNALTINNSDIEHVYAGLFMELFTDFEALLEELFLGLLHGDLYSRTYAINRKARISPKSEIKNIVFGGKAYVNWLPYKENTLTRANMYINLGEPFTRLSNEDILKIGNYHAIRNAIAHKSENSLGNFNKIIAPLPLLPIEKTPTGYLRSKPHVAGQTQFEIAAIELNSLTNILCA